MKNIYIQPQTMVMHVESMTLMQAVSRDGEMDMSTEITNDQW